MEIIKLSRLKTNAKNPRQIRGEKFELLKQSVASFQKMMELRPIIVDETFTILGGNMRYAAIKALGLKEIPVNWVKQANDLTEDEKREFIIKDNGGFGDWDWDVLANEWSDLPLSDWGIDVPTDSEKKELDLSDSIKSSFIVEVFCVDEVNQKETYDRLTETGYQCRVLTL